MARDNQGMTGMIHANEKLMAHRDGRINRKGSDAGFTLIELMIVVAIVAILAAVATASYTHFVTKSRRAAAATCLQERAQFMERYYTTNLSYEGAANPPAQCDGGLSPTHYVVSFSADPTATAYTLLATPQGGQAARDGKCGTLSLDAQGTRGKSGSAATINECW